MSEEFGSDSDSEVRDDFDENNLFTIGVDIVEAGSNVLTFDQISGLLSNPQNNTMQVNAQQTPPLPQQTVQNQQLTIEQINQILQSHLHVAGVNNATPSHQLIIQLPNETPAQFQERIDLANRYYAKYPNLTFSSIAVAAMVTINYARYTTTYDPQLMSVVGELNKYL
jgi:hypothetical protein